jgi:hypothetical protein
MNVTPEQGIEWFFGPPIAGQQFHDTKDNGYGNVPPFLIPPLALLGLGMALWHLLRGRDRWSALVLLALALPLLAASAISPARHWARLNLHIVLAAWLLASYFVGLARRRMLAEGVVGALVIGAAITLYWSEPAWDVDWERQARLARIAPIERAAQRDEIFTLLPTETARARERELGDGDLVIVAVHPWVGLFWNERFSNRVEIEPAQGVRPEEWIARARRRGAEWVVVDGRSPLAHALRQDERWQEVGPADNSGAPTLAFRSRRASAARGAGASRAPRTP